MGDNKALNPVFPVDAGTFEACLPKVCCPACGTIVAVRVMRRHERPRCPACGQPLNIVTTDQGPRAESA